jgi:hypothetical protein
MIAAARMLVQGTRSWVGMPQTAVLSFARFGYDYFRYVIYRDPNWDFRTFDVSRDVEAAEKLDHANVLKAVDPNLTPFVLPRWQVDSVSRVE